MPAKVARKTFTIGNGNRSGFSIGSGHARPGLEIKTRTSTPEILTPYDVYTSRKFEPSAIMLVGRRGRGKTLGMTGLGAFQKERFRLRNIPSLIGSNYWTDFSDILNPDMIQWLNADGLWDPRAKNMYCLIDEAGAQFANRRSLNAVNVDFIQVLVQIRKLMTEMVFTTQFPQWVDIQVLYQIDLFIMMDSNYDNSIIDMYIFDWWGQWTGRNNKKAWPPQMEDVDAHATMYNTDSLFNRYRTNQVVPPPWAKNRKQIVLSEWGEQVGGEEKEENPWGALTETARQAMDQGPAQSVDELLDRQTDPFLAGSLWAAAKRLDPRMKKERIGYWEKDLMARGYEKNTDGEWWK